MDTFSKSKEAPTTTVEVFGEADALKGYIIDPSHYPDNAAGLKKGADGFVLIPQPLDTEDDPLNWSPRKKWLTVAIIAYIAALADFTGGTAIITVIPQSMYVTVTMPAVMRLPATDSLSLQAMAPVAGRGTTRRCGQSIHNRSVWTFCHCPRQFLRTLACHLYLPDCDGRHMRLVCNRNELQLLSCCAHHQWLFLQRRPRRCPDVGSGSLLLPRASAGHQLH